MDLAKPRTPRWPPVESAASDQLVTFPNGKTVIGDSNHGMYRLCGLELATAGFLCEIREVTATARRIEAAQLDVTFRMTTHDLVEVLLDSSSFGPNPAAVSQHLLDAARDAGVAPPTLLAKHLDRPTRANSPTATEVSP